MRILFVISALSFVLAVNAEKPLVVASASIFADMAHNIGGDKIDVRSVVPIGGDPHRYEATPDDAALLAKADLILINGLTFEGWINEVIANSGSKAMVKLITAGIQPISSQIHSGATDPHAWMDAENGQIYIRNIRDALIAIDPQNAAFYEQQHARYNKELTALHQFIKDRMATIPPHHRILITSHDAFSYFGKKYGLTVSAMMGVSTEADAQTSDMKRVVDALEKNKVPAIFIESTINPKMLQQIAKDHGVIIGGSLYADSVGEAGTDGDSYVGMLRHNADVIATALSQPLKSVALPGQELNWTLYGLLVILLMMSWLVFIKFLKK
jgi:ABC-type Zn uptake system ZnuABC Zn-binding protein ZnuA